MAFRPKPWLTAAIAAASLALAPAAFADGTFAFESDAAHVDAQAKTTDGQGAYFYVLTFPSAVSQAETAGGAPCTSQFSTGRGAMNTDPNTVECPGSDSTGKPSPTREVLAVLAAAMACTDTIGLQTSIDNQSYRDDGKLIFSGTCTPPPPPSAPPDPNEQPAGGAVAQPHNGIVVGADSSGPPTVKLFAPPAFSSFSSFAAFDTAFTGGVRVASGDVNGDGLLDVVAGAGPGGGPHVKVFDGANGGLLKSFFAYDPAFDRGVFVASGDVNGDGRADIVVGPDSGGGPNVRVFSGADGSQLSSFLAFAAGFTGGVRVAVGDVNGDGIADLIAGTGPGAGAQVKVFDGKTDAVVSSFLPFAASFTGGVYVATGDVNGDGAADVIVGAGQGGGPHVKAFDGKTGAVLLSLLAYPSGITGGVRVAAGDVNGDGVPDILTVPGPGTEPEVKAFDGLTGASLASFMAFDPADLDGAFVAASSFSGPAPQIRGDGTLPLNAGGVAVRTSCPADVQGGFCAGSMFLLLPAVHGAAIRAAARKPRVLAQKKFKVAAGKSLKVHVALSRRARRLLGKNRTPRVIVRVVTHDAGGNVSLRQRTVTLKRR